MLKIAPVIRLVLAAIVAIGLGLPAASLAAAAPSETLPPGIEKPLAPPTAPLGTCEYASVTLQAAFEGFWAMPRSAVPARMAGQTQSARYDSMPGASVRGKPKSYRSVKPEYDRRVAELSGCVVTIQGRPFGLEAMIEAAPANAEADEIEAVFRLRDAPEYLSNLRIHVDAYWRTGSSWTVVAAGSPSEYLQGHGQFVHRTEQRLRRAGLAWTPVSTAPSGVDSLADFSVEALIKAGNELLARAADETDTPVNWRMRALPLFDAACRRGSMLGCGREGVLLSEGAGGVSSAQARPYLEKGCAVKDSDSCYRLAVNMLVGYPSAETRERTLTMIFAACENGTGAACAHSADSLMGSPLEPGATRDWPRIIKLYNRGCGLQNAYACLRGGKLYYTGQPGLEKDWEQARNMFTVACSGRGTLMGEACRYAGTMYVAGQGGARNDEVAKVMFKRGCDKLDRDSCKVIGLPAPQ